MSWSSWDFLTSINPQTASPPHEARKKPLLGANIAKHRKAPDSVMLGARLTLGPGIKKNHNKKPRGKTAGFLDRRL